MITRRMNVPDTKSEDPNNQSFRERPNGIKETKERYIMSLVSYNSDNYKYKVLNYVTAR